MDIAIHHPPKTPDAAALRSHATERLRRALQRLARLVQRAVVRLKDLNGPRGGVDKVCQIELVLPGQRPVVVVAQDANWFAALESALERATHALMRRIDGIKPKASWRSRARGLLQRRGSAGMGPPPAAGAPAPAA